MMGDCVHFFLNKSKQLSEMGYAIVGRKKSLILIVIEKPGDLSLGVVI